MTILVTGGAGFIGSHLCAYLLKQGDKIIAIDNLSTGRLSNIDELKKNRNFQFLRHDIIKPLRLKTKINQIYNLASPASPPAYQAFPLETLKTNTIGMLNMLELAKRHKSRILQASTSEVYGDPKEHPQKESYWGNVNILGPRACYDESKRVAETFCMEYYRNYGLSIRIARIFNTYGPQMQKDDGRVVSNFVVQALKGKPLTVYGQGRQTRSFCYIDDMIEGISALMNAKDFIGPVNLGNPEEFTIKELASIILKLSGSKSKISYHPLPVDDPKERQPDITLAKKKLHWQPRVGLEQGLKKTIEYFRKEKEVIQ